MFVLAVATVIAASATHRAYPLFVGWVPLIAIPWILARPEPGAEAPSAEPPSSPEDEPEN
jgi:hypothetical protein